MDPSSSNAAKSPRSYELSGQIMLSAIVVLFTVVLLILFLHLYVRWHVIRRASRRARRRRQLVFASDGQPPVHCAAANRGLDPSIIASLPILLISDCAEEDDESGECAVCLNEFKEGEKIRCLPRCNHSFHIDCIDMWFCSHSTCPLCRAAVEVVKDGATNNSSETPAIDTLVTTGDSNGSESSQPVEEMGSSSSDSGCGEVRIDIPAIRAEGSDGQNEQMSLGLELQEDLPLKSASSRMVLIRWLLIRDRRLYCGGVAGSEHDLERNDGELP